jgi:hypothetical protein
MVESHNPVGAPGEPEVLLWPLLLKVHSTVSLGWIVTDEGKKKRPPLPTVTMTVVALAGEGPNPRSRPMPSTAARLIGRAPTALRKAGKMRGVEFADNGLDFSISVFRFPSIRGGWGTVVPHFLGIRDKIFKRYAAESKRLIAAMKPAAGVKEGLQADRCLAPLRRAEVFVVSPSAPIYPALLFGQEKIC